MRDVKRSPLRSAPCQGDGARAYPPRRRGGRVAEGGGLLNRYTGKPVSRVRIPSSPPRFAPLWLIAWRVLGIESPSSRGSECRSVASGAATAEQTQGARSARPRYAAATCDLRLQQPRRSS